MSPARSGEGAAPVRPAGATEPAPRYQLHEAQLLSHFTEKSLAPLLAACLPRRELSSLAPRLGLSPLPGKRLKTMKPADHARLLARSCLEQEKARKAVLEVLNANLPAPFPELGMELDEARTRLLLSLAAQFPPAMRIGLVLSTLEDEQRAPLAIQSLEDGLLNGIREEQRAADPEGGQVQKLQAQLERAEQRARIAEQALAEQRRSVDNRERGLKERIEELQGRLADLQRRLGQKNRECDEIRGEWENLKGDLRIAFRRAARYKNALDDTRSASERERALEAALARERQRADIEASKLEIIEYQLDLLEQDEESAAAETRILHEHDPVPERVLHYVEKFASPPRILVVGGAGKQRSHRERDFACLKERLGIEGEWRFAEYGSWHRNLPRLRNDIRDRFDLVFVLHWNRTTFVQKMHDEARAANARVRTVPYRGFLSLEKAVREEIDRFVQEKL